MSESVLPAVKRIIAIGDIHGDYELAVNSLKIAGLIDKDFNWIATPLDTIVVQVGDQVDRCRPNVGENCHQPGITYEDEDSDYKIIKLFTDLDKKARKKGGKVISLLGNHEIMNIQGNMTYVSYEGIKGYEGFAGIADGLEGRKQAFRQGGEIAKELAKTRKSVVIIGSNIFVHAGVLPLLAEKYGENLDNINKLISKWLMGTETSGKINDLLNSENVSPFWTRLYGNIKPNVENDPICKDFLDPVLETYGLNNMIIGHTPQYFTNHKGINSTCSGKLHRIDVSASKAFELWDTQKTKGREAQVFEILNDTELYVIKNDKTKIPVSQNGGQNSTPVERISFRPVQKRYKLVIK